MHLADGRRGAARWTVLLGATALFVISACDPSEEPPSPSQIAISGSGVVAAPERVAPTGDIDESGRWLMGSRGRYRNIVSLDEGVLSIESVRGADREERRPHVEAAGDGRFRVSFDDHEQTVEVFVRGGGGAAVAVLSGENGIAELLRVRPMPAELLGQWAIGWSSNYHLAAGVLTFAPDRWNVTVHGETKRAGPAYAVQAPRPGELGVALVSGSDYARLHHVVRHGDDDALIVWAEMGDQHLVLHREGRRPAWLGPVAPPATADDGMAGSGAGAPSR